jgi:hypothetical protein
MPKIPLVLPATLSQLPRVHGSSFAADGRKVRNLSVCIFAELLPWSTARIALRPRTLHPLRPRPSLDEAGRRRSGGASAPRETTHNRPMPATRAGKETLP